MAWGLFERFSAKSGTSSVLPEPASTLSAPQVAITGTPKPADENALAEVNASASTSPSSTASRQQNGLPLGVTQAALNYNKELYQKYPGLKPPLINTDGRDLSPEATQELQAPPIMLSNPPPNPGVLVRPFPLVMPNTQADQSASPDSSGIITPHPDDTATGSLIAASGPVGFNGLQIFNIEFNHDNLVVTFAPSGQSFSKGSLVGPFAVWVLDEFGHLISAVGNQGPHQGFVLGSVTLSGPTGSPNQLWHWVGATAPPMHFELVVEEFNSSGSVLNGFNYGPF